MSHPDRTEGNIPQDSRSLYLGLLHAVTMPGRPEDLPEEVFLPREMLGDIWSVISDNTSRSIIKRQVVLFDPSSQEYDYVPPKPTSGVFTYTGDLLVRIESRGERYFDLTSDDIARIRTNLHEGFIHLFGSLSRLVALFQTEHGRKGFVTSKFERVRVLKKVEEMTDQGKTTVQAAINEGFGVYVFQSADFFRPDELMNGVMLHRENERLVTPRFAAAAE